jgi:ligand-binding sensor domain-containing protein
VKDDSGYLWLGTLDGLDRFDPVKETFVHYDVPDTSGSNDNKNILYLLIDHDKHLWIGTFLHGLVKMNLQTGSLTYFRHNAEDSNTLRNNQVLGIAEDKTSIWAATADGLDRIDKRNGALKHYLLNANVKSAFIDATGIVWAGTPEGLYYFDASSNTFTRSIT